jgi:5-methyltetrahydrofolate--homocysteine methyltransferase
MAGTLDGFAGNVTILDGAWGTQLHGRGLPAGACPDAWNAENPSAVETVARAYVQAGAQIILTNTFRANRLALAHWGLDGRAAELAERGAAISRRAAGKDVKVFASIGPSGKIVMMGQTTPEEIHRAFAEQASALARGGADAILCESFFELEEISLAAKAVRENTPLPLVLSMTFDVHDDKAATMMGVTPAQLAAACAELSAGAVGANCGAGPKDYVVIARQFRAAGALPVWIKPNAGLPVVRGEETIFPMSPKQFAAVVPALIEAGANFIGGCCGTTPEHIRAIRTAARKHR